MTAEEFDIRHRYYIETTGQIKIFRPPPETVKECGKSLAEAYADNDTFLHTFQHHKPLKPISGSFICAHWPDSPGIPATEYTVTDWQKVFNDFSSLGLDTAILQASAWKELEEVYYPSTLFSTYKKWNLLEPLTQAATNAGITLYIGGLGTVSGWKKALSKNYIEKEIIAQLSCFEEILKLYSGIAGLYITPETAFTGSRNKEKEKIQNHVLKKLLKEIHGWKMRGMISPATKYFPGKEMEMQDAWNTILCDSGLDILAPQDSIGTGGNRLSNQKNTFKTWKNVADSNGSTLWSNVEIFSRNNLDDWRTDFRAAEPLRVHAQIAAASPWVDKLVCWEAPFCLAPEAGPDGDRLRKKIFNADFAARCISR